MTDWIFKRTRHGYTRTACLGSDSAFIERILTAPENRTWRQQLARWTICLVAGHEDAGVDTARRHYQHDQLMADTRETFCGRCRQQILLREIDWR